VILGEGGFGVAARRQKKRGRRKRREALVHGHLEGVSRGLLEQHPKAVQQFIGKNAGIYALYRKDKLYYVGLATALRIRLKAHIKNRHGQSWDSFSIYFTNRDQHLREIEALILRIAGPPGIKQKGKLAQSRDLRRRITRAIREKLDSEVSSLFRRKRRGLDHGENLRPAGDNNALISLLPQGGGLRATHNDKVYRARARPDGRIRYNGNLYSSLTLAAKAAIKRTVNGWWFWKVKRGGYWVRLTDIRRAGTPIYPR
jgi:hypothetical protein